MSLHEHVFTQNTLTEVEVRAARSLERIQKGEGIYVVAVVDGSIFGTLGLMREKHPLMRHRAALDDEVVNPAFDNMNLHCLLFEQAAAFAKSRGITIITGKSRKNHFTQKFFSDNLFTEAGRIPGGLVESWNDNKTYDEVMYYLPIQCD